MNRIEAPFTPEQVTALNAWQQRAGFHPFTCGYDSSHVLNATAAGWSCPHDDYVQTWAHDFMAAPVCGDCGGSGTTLPRKGEIGITDPFWVHDCPTCRGRGQSPLTE